MPIIQELEGTEHAYAKVKSTVKLVQVDNLADSDGTSQAAKFKGWLN